MTNKVDLSDKQLLQSGASEATLGDSGTSEKKFAKNLSRTLTVNSQVEFDDDFEFDSKDISAQGNLKSPLSFSTSSGNHFALTDSAGHQANLIEASSPVSAHVDQSIESEGRHSSAFIGRKNFNDEYTLLADGDLWAVE